MLSLISFLPAILQTLPTTVAGIEYLSTEASGSTKQQLALDSATVLTTIMAKALPGSDALTSEINDVLKAAINLTVAGFNAAGTFVHKQPAAAAA